MKWLSFSILLAISVSSAFAQDINPSRQVVPNQFINPPGKRFSIFSGDPERVQRANEVDLKDFKGELNLAPASISKTPPAADQTNVPTTLKVNFRIKNLSDKKSYTLSFPDSQRYDIAISAGKDNMIYLWSADKLFEQKVGASFLNPGEVLSWTENIPIEQIVKTAQPGAYDVKVILANYPEINANGKLTITP
ncbi:MAG: hypothetical protein LBH01_06300 [Verrucomicrobiales bacterium]|jgi:hypothetical protein|nr:hypothetical protein [Verrucomicrobiales bacterium]